MTMRWRPRPHDRRAWLEPDSIAMQEASAVDYRKRASRGWILASATVVVGLVTYVAVVGIGRADRAIGAAGALVAAALAAAGVYSDRRSR